MGQRRAPGLQLRGDVWHIDKRYIGGRICESTGTSDFAEAQKHFARRLEEVRHAEIYGVRPTRTFREAASRYLREFSHKRAINRDAQDLKLIDPHIGEMPLARVHMGTLQPFVELRRKAGRAAGTVNRTLAVVRRILNLSASLWRDEFGLTWLETAPMIQLLEDSRKRKPYPLSWEEQDGLFALLPPWLHAMAVFAANTGCREQEVCKLSWRWEVRLEELGASVFVLPDWVTKNGRERVVVLNQAAAEVVEHQRGLHPERVFTHRGEPLAKMYTTSWKRARSELAAAVMGRSGRPAPWGLANIRVHDLRHTFGRRLRSMGVSFEDRQDLLGHESGRMTTHYSAAEIGPLIDAVGRICAEDSRKTHAITMLKVLENRATA